MRGEKLTGGQKSSWTSTKMSAGLKSFGVAIDAQYNVSIC